MTGFTQVTHIDSLSMTLPQMVNTTGVLPSLHTIGPISDGITGVTLVAPYVCADMIESWLYDAATGLPKWTGRNSGTVMTQYGASALLCGCDRVVTLPLQLVRYPDMNNCGTINTLIITPVANSSSTSLSLTMSATAIDALYIQVAAHSPVPMNGGG